MMLYTFTMSSKLSTCIVTSVPLGTGATPTNITFTIDSPQEITDNSQEGGKREHRSSDLGLKRIASRATKDAVEIAKHHLDLIVSYVRIQLSCRLEESIEVSLLRPPIN